MSDLKPCPFCGNKEPEIERFGTHRQSCIVACGSCGARHESSDEGEDSGTSWNHRAQSSTPNPVEVGTTVQAGQVLTDDKLLAMWEGTDGERALRPTLGKNKILSFARAVEAAVLAKRVPMTDAQIENALRSEPMADNEESFALGIRYAERHHGIAGKEGA